MSANSKIEWTDHSFNPWIGCTKVSPACDHCYAEVSTPSRTLGVTWGPHAERRRTSASNWAMPKRWNAQAEAFQAQHGRRQRVFCASLADVFDNAVNPQWRVDLFNLIEQTPNLDWLLLTKRIGNVQRMMVDVAHGLFWMDRLETGALPPNVWLGATIANQEEADRDIPKLLAVPAAKRFLSMEPLLGRVYIEDIPDPSGDVCLKPLAGLRWVLDGQGRCEVRSIGARIDWVIVGGESGRHARPMHPDWARSLRDQCQAARVPFFFKQWGEWVDADNGPSDDAAYEGKADCWAHIDGGHHDGAMGVDFFQTYPMYRVGKKAAGRLLDGREWDEVPA